MAWLIGAFGTLGMSASLAWKLDIIFDLDRLEDIRIAPFFLSVLADPSEPTRVRVNVLKRLRNGRLKRHERLRVVDTVLRLLSDRADSELTVPSALALAEFTDLPGVVSALSVLALEAAGTFEQRYAAFTSMQRAGPTQEAIETMRLLAEDELLGPSAANVLDTWRSA